MSVNSQVGVSNIKDSKTAGMSFWWMWYSTAPSDNHFKLFLYSILHNETVWILNLNVNIIFINYYIKYSILNTIQRLEVYIIII